MKILLLQSSVYFPSYGGGNKANRLLLEALAARGHQCWSLSKSVDAQTVVDTTSEHTHLSSRGIRQDKQNNVTTYELNRIHVIALDTRHEALSETFIKQQYEQIKPDVILVSDDKNGSLLTISLALAPLTTILFIHTNLHLPFGNEATDVCPVRERNYKQCKHIVTATKYTQDYLLKNAGLASQFLAFPVFGSGPFKNLSDFNKGHIGMINPCSIKGMDIFIGLAKKFKHESFMAVPTWGADNNDLHQLSTLNNMQIIEPQDDIEKILKQLKILIVPSLISETFGYVVVEAMLRGIPVLASDLGGLRHAKLGVNYLLPVQAAINQNGSHAIPEQDIKPWCNALNDLTQNKTHYQQCSKHSYQRANEYANSINVSDFENYFDSVAAC